jgi:hypothetical protein
MAQKTLTKSKKFAIVGASKRQNKPTQQNLKKANLSNRVIHKNSTKLSKIIETTVASQVAGASGMGGAATALNVVKMDKQLLGHLGGKKGKKSKGTALKK